MRKIIFIPSLFAIFFVILCSYAFAETIKNIEAFKKDLSPMEGSVIVIQKNIYGINKGIDSGIKQGELWTLYGEGMSVKDPKTGQELGKTANPVGFFIVTRPQQQFSEIEIKCKGKCDIKSNMTARRFSDIPAVLYDTSNLGVDFYDQIRGVLPNLQWKSREVVTDSLKLKIPRENLSFVAKSNGVTLWSGGEVIGFYEFGKDEAPQKQASPYSTKVSPYASVPGISGMAVSTGSVPGLRASGVRQQVMISSYRPVGSLDQLVFNLEMFELEKGGSPHFVYFYANTLYVQSINNSKRYVYDYNGFGDVVSISTGPLGVIAFNIFIKGEGIKSRILQFTGEGFKEIVKDEPYVFAFFDTDSDGEKETLLGQNYDTMDFFGPGVWKLKIVGNSVKRIDKFSAPSTFQLNGALVYDLDRNGILEVGFYLPAKKFLIYQGSSIKWESPESLGGSIKSVIYEEQPGMQSSPTRTIIFWSQPAVLSYKDINAIVIPANEGSILSMVGGDPKRGGVGIIAPYAGGYRYHQLGTQFEGPVQSVFIYKDELYIVVVEGNFFMKRGRTHVLAVPVEDILSEII